MIPTNQDQEQSSYVVYHAQVKDDDTATKFFRLNSRIVLESGGILNVSESHGCGPAYLVLSLTPTHTPEDLAQKQIEGVSVDFKEVE